MQVSPGNYFSTKLRIFVKEVTKRILVLWHFFLVDWLNAPKSNVLGK